ncbi:hypothetical protein ES703_96216 [subsurface metagenome]
MVDNENDLPDLGNIEDVEVETEKLSEAARAAAPPPPVKKEAARKPVWNSFRITGPATAANKTFNAIINATLLHDKPGLDEDSEGGAAILFVVAHYLEVDMIIGEPWETLVREMSNTGGQIISKYQGHDEGEMGKVVGGEDE